MNTQLQNFCPLTETGEHTLIDSGKHFETGTEAVGAPGRQIQFTARRCEHCNTTVIDRSNWEPADLSLF